MRRALAEIKSGPKNREMSLGAILVPVASRLGAWEEVAIRQQAEPMRVSAEDHAQAETASVQAVPSGPLLSTATHAKEPPTWTR